MRAVVILGSTGSIGVQALEVIASNPSLFKVVGISSAGSNPELVIAQAKQFKVSHVGVVHNADVVRTALSGVTVIDGVNASTEIAAINCDVVVNGITGSIGLGPTLAALDAGNTLALANKESLVAGGDLVMSRAREQQIIPVDSEHSAIFQSALAGKKSEIKKIVLTASGGAFRDRSNLDGITVEDALNIEAVIHPQSVVHSLVEFNDGSTIAQASPPNMKGAIAYAMNWPDRLSKSTAPIDWSIPHTWTFAPINAKQFPSVGLARHCGEVGGGLPAIFNAANEVAVAAFISKKLEFKSIVGVIAGVVADLEKDSPKTLRDLSDVSALEDDARTRAQAHLLRLAP